MENNTPSSLLLVEQLTKQVDSGGDPLIILNSLDLIIQKGETVAILGVSGSGKSTLLWILAGLDTASSGRVVLDGHDFTRLNEDERAKLRSQYIGFIFQSFYLLPQLTALENVLLPLELLNLGSPRKRALEVLEQVNLTQRLHHYPHQLSGGEQQRVAIARAYSIKPKLLLADEMTGNLDQNTAEQIIELTLNLNKAYGTTLVLVTHDESLAKRCQRRLKLSNGKLHDVAAY